MTQINLPAKNSKSATKNRPRKQAKRITADYLHNAGLYYLQRFAASSGHFQRVMMRKIDRSCAAHPDQSREDCIALLGDLIDRFQRAGLLNDEVYARGMITSLRNRGLSSRAIQAKMSARALPQPLISRALQNHMEEAGIEDAHAADLNAAFRYARKRRIGPFASGAAIKDKEEQQKRYERAMASLARAGFGYDIARTVLETPPDDAQTYLD